MADWRRRSIAGGPSPATPNEDIPGALHLDFFYRPSAARVAFPSDGAGGTRELDTAIMSARRLTNAITDEAFLLPTADGDKRMAVASPATTDEASPLQPRQCQPVGTAAIGGGGSRRRLSWSPDGSGGRVSCPSSSQLPPLNTDHVAVSSVNVEAGEELEEEEEAVSPWSGQARSPGRSEEDDDAVSSGWGGEDGETMSSERGEENDEARSAGPDEDYDEAMLSGHGEEDDDDEAMSPERREGEDDGVDEDDEDGEDDEEEEEEEDEEEEEEEPKVPKKCVDCWSVEKLVMLVPCRHSCYCEHCFRISQWRGGPAGMYCPACGRKYKRGHPQSGRLRPK